MEDDLDVVGDFFAGWGRAQKFCAPTLCVCTGYGLMIWMSWKRILAGRTWAQKYCAPTLRGWNMDWRMDWKVGWEIG